MSGNLLHSPLTEEEERDFIHAISDPEKRRAAIKILTEAGLLGASPPERDARHQA